jgi:hypothetical protein
MGWLCCQLAFGSTRREISRHTYPVGSLEPGRTTRRIVCDLSAGCVSDRRPSHWLRLKAAESRVAANPRLARPRRFVRGPEAAERWYWGQPRSRPAPVASGSGGRGPRAQKRAASRHSRGSTGCRSSTDFLSRGSRIGSYPSPPGPDLAACPSLYTGSSAKPYRQPMRFCWSGTATRPITIPAQQTARGYRSRCRLRDRRTQAVRAIRSFRGLP